MSREEREAARSRMAIRTQSYHRQLTLMNEMQKQQEALPQFLKGGVRLDVLGDVVPEHDRRDDQVLAPQLEQVQDDDPAENGDAY